MSCGSIPVPILAVLFFSMDRSVQRQAELPSSRWLIALDQMLHAAALEAECCGYELVLERSDRSEARYLHVCRQGTWFGIRIATHLPVYACSRDYSQIITSRVPLSDERAYYVRLMREKVRDGGRIVANPQCVASYLDLTPAEFEQLSARRKADLRHRANHIARWMELV